MARRKKSADWLADAAMLVESGGPRPEGRVLICASGISPSGNIHLGNLREVMTTHLVTEELIRRGHKAEHVHSWDDLDRLRKVPAGAPDWLHDYIGHPLCDVPDPGGEFDSYASRYIHEFQASVERLGIQARWVRQSEMYRKGVYTAAVKKALVERHTIFDMLARFQTKKLQTVPIEERRANFWPYKVYCPACGKDTTTTQAYHEPTATVTYSCVCDSVVRTTCLDEESIGKLVWKVDWPMRWAHEGVDFEPGGEDHAAPGSSFTVGKDVVKLFGGVAPAFIEYGFVGMGGRTKMSSSVGGAATPAFAMRFIEPALLRWLYLRRPPKTKFNIDFGSEIWRQYDEWDALARRVNTDNATPLQVKVLAHAVRTSLGPVQVPSVRAPFRVIFSAVDMTSGHTDQIVRILREHLDDAPDDLLQALQPRLDCAIGWVANCLPEEERQFVRSEFSAESWAEMSDFDRSGVVVFLDHIDAMWSYKGLSDLVYGVAKLQSGLTLAAPASPELKVAQRRFFVVLYQL
ncbi:MAG: lysyl-tRNA synthetase class 1, partial [Kiritimatiellia bacterium]